MDKRTCSIEDCDRPHYGREMCSMHYQRWRIHGDPHHNPRGRVLRHVLALYLDPSSHDDWPFATSLGYGLVKDEHGNQTTAHALACTLAHGPRPDGMEVRHSCRNRHCFYAEHLSWGTPSENNQDKKRDGTHQTGERHNNHRLTWDEVDQIRALYEAGGVTQAALAKKFNVTRGNIGHIVRYEAWTYL